MQFPTTLPSLEKDALVEAQTPFYITEPPALVDTQYGPRIRVAVRTADDEGALMFGSTTVTGRQLMDLAAAMTEAPGDECGPLTLVHTPLPGGKSTYTIVNANQ